MAYCQNCGGQMADGAKFCPSCGTAAGSAGDENVRKTSYEGEIKKCPNCGAVLPSGTFTCPECECEIRNAQASKAADEFNNQLKNAKSDQEYFNVIESFAIPNTREDIGYFLTMAKSNVEREYNPDDAHEVQTHKSWVVLFNNIKNRVDMMNERERKEFQATIDGTKISKCYSTKDADAFKVALLKCSDSKQKIELIKTYPIKPNPENLMTLVSFIDSQIEFKNPIVSALKTIGLILLYFFTFGIAYFIMRKKQAVDYTKKYNNAWFARLREIQKQSKSLLNDDQESKIKLENLMKSVKSKKLLSIVIDLAVMILVIAFFIYFLTT